MTESSEKSTHDFLKGGGEMGAAIRTKEWSQTVVGPPETWPPELRTVIRLMLTTNHPIFVFWGEDLTCFWNDAYSQSIGPERHPVALGRPGREVWEEIWDIIGPQIDLVMSGKGATWHQDHLVPITRHGKLEEVYWTYSYSPIDAPDAPQGVGGVLVICTETTARVRAEQALSKQLHYKEVLLREVNHRIKNSLQLVSSLLSLERKMAPNDDTKASLARASARIGAISTVHELIYRSDNIETVDFGRYLDEICRGISYAILDGEPRISMECNAPNIVLPTDLAITIALLMNELVTNAMKHAFPDGRDGTIRVGVLNGQSSIELSVADDGVGMSASDNREGHGMQLIAGLVRQIDGHLTHKDDGGHSVSIEILFKAN